MANQILWDAAYTSRSTVLTTELNSLGSGSRTDGGTELSNQTNLDQYGVLEIQVTFASSPAAGSYLQLHMITAPNGTNYEDGSSSVDPGAHTVVANVPVRATTNAQRLLTDLFVLKPGKTKFILYNGTDKSFPASGSTVTLYTANDEVQ